MRNFLHISISQAEATSLEDLQAVKELNEQELALVVGGSRGHGPEHEQEHGHEHEHGHDHDRDDWHNRDWHHDSWHNWHHHDEHKRHGHK